MEKFQILAHPWWVNVLILVPCVAYFSYRREGLQIARRQLLTISAFAVAFGFVEAAVVVYLRSAAGLLPGDDTGALAAVRRLATGYLQQQAIAHFPRSLLIIELVREAATMAMLVCVGTLAATRMRERWAAFLWAFAVWDITYYACLWATVGWPSSLKDFDVLFLIPVPWIAQVWYPLLVSALTLLALASQNGRAQEPAKGK